MFAFRPARCGQAAYDLAGEGITALCAAAGFPLAADERVGRRYPATCRAIRPGGSSS